MTTNNSRSTILIFTLTFLHLAFALESFVVHSIFTLHYLHYYSSNYLIAIIMSKLSASRERALKNARRVKTKKKKKKKKQSKLVKSRDCESLRRKSSNQRKIELRDSKSLKTQSRSQRRIFSTSMSSISSQQLKIKSLRVSKSCRRMN